MGVKYDWAAVGREPSALEYVSPLWTVEDINEAIKSVVQANNGKGGKVVFEPGEYPIYSQTINVDTTGYPYSVVHIDGYGAALRTSGAIAAVTCKGGGVIGNINISGLQINHRGNADALYGFECLNTWNARFFNCSVVAHGVSANYAAWHLANSTPTNNDTGCFWTKIIDCWMRKLSGTDVGDISIGVLLEGAANATVINGTGFNNVLTGVVFQAHAGGNYVANGVLIDGNFFEAYDTAIHQNLSGTLTVPGCRIINNRFEAGTTVLSITGSTGQPSVPTYLAGNAPSTSAGTYINNPNNIYVNSHDMSISPSIADVGCKWKQNTWIVANDGSTFPFTVQPIGGARGARVMNGTASATVLQLNWSGTGNGSQIKGNGSASIDISSVRSISQTGTEAKNLRGSATFASAATAAVTFATAEPDATYFISVAPNVNETIWVTSKATTGFALNSSNAASTAVVDWHLIR